MYFQVPRLKSIPKYNKRRIMNTVAEYISYGLLGMNEIMRTVLESICTYDPQLCHYQNHLVSTFYILQKLSRFQIVN